MGPGRSQRIEEDGRTGNVLYAFNVSRLSFINLSTMANSRLARLRGLLGGREIRLGEGIWVIPSRGVHPTFTMAPVDLIYLDSELRVVHTIENLARFRITPLRLECASVLQLPAGSIATSGTRLGDQLVIKSPKELDEYWASQLPSTAP